MKKTQLLTETYTAAKAARVDVEKGMIFHKGRSQIMPSISDTPLTIISRN